MSTTDSPRRLLVGVPVRNQLHYARACLETLRLRRSAETFILIVDDASEPECATYLRGFVEQTPDSALLVNPGQRGFPYSCNEILYNCDAPSVCLLNSDTLVSPGWDGALLDALLSDGTVGFVGPSTSWAHTRQSLSGPCLSRHDQDAASVAELAVAVGKHFAGQIEEMPTLSGFCLMFRREVADRAGYFDERFGLGGAEEDDFILRGRRCGFRALWVKDVYVHHFGHSSFRAEIGGAVQDLWSRNRLILEIKQMLPGMKEWAHRPEAGRIKLS